jgi:DNA-binding NarL/FixJ family response regulator
MTSTCIVIADDHPMVRRALAESLSELRTAHYQITEAGSVGAVREVLQRGRTDLLLLDLNMPGMDGLLGLSALRADFPAVPILVVSALEDPVITRQAIELGAAGFLPKSSPVSAIGAAVEAVLAGDLWLPAELASGAESANGDTAARVAELTPQQRRVLILLSDGKLNKEIAFDLGVTEATVKAHVTQILRKLGVHTRTQAAVVARQLNPTRWPGPER